MKFIYEYRTPDNVKHNGRISASSKEVAYAELKASGIRPGRVCEAPGLFNKLLGKGKRWIAIVLLGIASIVLVTILALHEKKTGGVMASLDDTARRQIIGDAVVIEKGIRNRWADVFASDGERFLAAYAIPGTPVVAPKIKSEELTLALSTTTLPTNKDSIEARQIKSIVEGMKSELRKYLSSGGTVEKYCKRLASRQFMEVQYYQTAKNELERAASEKKGSRDVEELWERRNDRLRRLGIKLVEFPE